jgi:DNA (cytosine-5)-methyltransferase 1
MKEVMPRSKKNFTFIDLFAGIGGMRLGFERAGGKCLLTCEIDDAATETYSLNFSPKHDHVYAGDIGKLLSSEIPDHDVVVAGFPCQPYSIAGLRRGLKDERGAVFLEIIRILRDKRPPVVLLENVKGIKAHDKGQTFAFMISLLEELGYYTRVEVLNSMTHGNIPQNRERVFIVGFLDESSARKFKFPDAIPLTKTIHEMLEPNDVPYKYLYDSRFDCFQELKKDVVDSDTVYQWRRQYVRENKSKVCPTLTANMGSGGHNVPIIKTGQGIRKLTPRECANFQGFPSDFKLPDQADSRLYHQFGNSVTVPLISRIAEGIAQVL